MWGESNPYDPFVTRRVYLDNAATSFPKPPSVFDAMLRYGRDVGASPGRGHYAESREGARIIATCRQRLCTLFNGESADHVVFALNTSDALNLAIKGVVRAAIREKRGRGGGGDARPVHVVTTAMDHNSVLRPLNALKEDGLVEWTLVDCDPETGRVAPSSVCHAMREDTVLVAINHASNVSGVIQPIAQIGKMCRERGVLYLVDAAQSAGHVPIDVREACVDLLAFPGHKGLLGPQGTGGLYVRPSVVRRVATSREGGTGHLSELDVQPEEMPQRFEAGSHNTMGLAGLSEGVQWLLTRGVAACRAHELELIGVMLEGLRERGCRMMGGGSHPAGPLSQLSLLGPTVASERVGTFSFLHDTLTPVEIAMGLEAGFGVLARSGIHCAPYAHRTLGSMERDGALGACRLSFGPFVTVEDVRYALDALAQVCAAIEPAPR